MINKDQQVYQVPMDDTASSGKRRFPILLVLLLVLAVAYFSRSLFQEPEILPTERTVPFGDTRGTIKVTKAAAKDLSGMAGVVQQTLSRLYAQMNETDPDSEISKINRVGNYVRMPVSKDAFRLLDLAKYYHNQTDGYFDLTMAPLRYAWGLGGTRPLEEPPTDELLADILHLVGMEYVEIFDDGAVAITSPECRIELGKFLHAYATDVAVLGLREKGMNELKLTIGTATRVLNASDGRGVWSEAIRIPELSEKPLGTVLLDNEAPALVYLYAAESTIDVGDISFSSYINPKTGKPVGGILFAVASGPTTTKAYALAEAAIIAGPHGVAQFLKEFKKYHLALIPVDDEQPVWISPSFDKRLTLAEMFASRLQSFD